MTGKIVIALAYPVEHSQFGTLKSLTMRRSTVRDRRAAMKASQSPEDQEVRLFANLCDVPDDVIDLLDESDYRKLQDTYTGFFAPPPPVAVTQTTT